MKGRKGRRLRRRANQTRNKENRARNKINFGSLNENVLLLCADFRSLFRQFCATNFAFFFLRCVQQEFLRSLKKNSIFIFLRFFVIILLFFLYVFASGEQPDFVLFFLRFVRVVLKGEIWR